MDQAYFRHLTKWFSPAGTIGGGTRRQSSNTSGQRSLKRHPSGSRSSEGTTPGMVPSLLRLPEGCLFSDRCPDVFDDCRKVAPAMVAAGENHLVRCLKYV